MTEFSESDNQIRRKKRGLNFKKLYNLFDSNKKNKKKLDFAKNLNFCYRLTFLFVFLLFLFCSFFFLGFKEESKSSIYSKV